MYLLGAKRINRSVSCIGNSKLLSRFHECFVHGYAGIPRDMQLPAHFSHECQPQYTHRVSCNVHYFMRGEGKGVVAKVLSGQSL